MIPISYNMPVSQIIPSIPIVPQTAPKQSDDTYSLESLQMHETRQADVSYTLKGIEFQKGLRLNTTA